MEVVTGAMSTLLPKLADLIKDEYNLQKSVRAEITFLKTELEYMEAALTMVSEAPIDQQPPNRLVKLWTRDVRELSYDLEDSIDAFMVHIANDSHVPTKAKKHSFRAFMERSMNLLRRGKIRHNIGVDVEEYKKRVKEVKERSDRYSKVDNIGAKPLAPSVDVHRLSALYTKATDLVGTKQKSDELVNKLLMKGDEASKHHLKVLSIVGFGGLGKTTLARTVYENLRKRFDCGAFVTVSHNPDIKNILSNILQGCGHLKYDPRWDEIQLINELRDFLRDKRYLIVIDDIWDAFVWDKIKYALDHNKLGSRVISTTRDLGVARHVGDDIYTIQPLSQDDSRKLFYHRIFVNEEKCLPNELAEVSENILRKCAGVPLAIIIVASMLANGKENTHKYWSKVYQILGSGMEDSPDEIKDMRRILSISYYHLPSHLKSCMLYLCSYPEDAQISTEDLIKKWVGEGFIPEARGKSCYEVGEDYIDELMNRGLIQPSNIDPDSNKAAYCYVHDMVLDLITNLSNEDGFLTTFDGQWPICRPNMIRRLSLQTSDEEYLNDEEYLKLLSTVSFNHVRSLTVSAEASALVPSISAFPVLRLLDLSGCWEVNNHYFKDVCHLFHLRYLRLSFTSITEIPKEIRNLKFLQVLDVSGTKVYELPSTFDQLSKLLYLSFDYLMGRPDVFGNLKDLQALYGTIIVEDPTMLHNFSGLTKVRHVQLQFNEWDESYDKPGMIIFEYLQMMDIRIRVVPRWISSLSTLTKLRMQVLTLGEEDLQVLGSIPSLSDLSIIVREPKQCRDMKLVVINSHSFLCLKKFKLCNTVMVVVFALGAMEKLERLVLTFGVKETMGHLPPTGFGFENLSSLVSITVQMYFDKADLKELEATKAAIQNAVHRNPNSPRLVMPVAKKVVVKVDLHDAADKKRIRDCLESYYESMSIDMKESKVTVVSFMDPVDVVTVLRRVGSAAIVSVGQAYEEVKGPSHSCSRISGPP